VKEEIAATRLSHVTFASYRHMWGMILPHNKIYYFGFLCQSLHDSHPKETSLKLRKSYERPEKKLLKPEDYSCFRVTCTMVRR
jgi:hypothetical protein